MPRKTRRVALDVVQKRFASSSPVAEVQMRSSLRSSGGAPDLRDPYVDPYEYSLHQQLVDCEAQIDQAEMDFVALEHGKVPTGESNEPCLLPCH
jgi:hypothetical protein